jgi:hypothetical protein
MQVGSAFFASLFIACICQRQHLRGQWPIFPLPDGLAIIICLENLAGESN